jgi:hypothetical protein
MRAQGKAWTGLGWAACIKRGGMLLVQLCVDVI